MGSSSETMKSYVGNPSQTDPNTGKMVTSGGGLLEWAQRNPALTEGLLTAGVAGLTGEFSAVQALGMGGRQMQQRQGQINAQIAAQAAAKQQALENEMKLKELGIRGAEAEAGILKSSADISLSKSQQALAQSKSQQDLITAATEDVEKIMGKNVPADIKAQAIKAKIAERTGQGVADIKKRGILSKITSLNFSPYAVSTLQKPVQSNMASRTY